MQAQHRHSTVNTPEVCGNLVFVDHLPQRQIPHQVRQRPAKHAPRHEARQCGWHEMRHDPPRLEMAIDTPHETVVRAPPGAGRHRQHQHTRHAAHRVLHYAAT